MDMPWREAIIKVLSEKGEAMHYNDIAKEIVSRGLRKSFGATPPNTVSTEISDSRKYDPNSPFERTSRGYYKLTESALEATGTSPNQTPSSIVDTKAEDSEETTGLINALGMYWSREKIDWSSAKPKLLGQQAVGSEVVDLCDQRGVYLLYDRNIVIYVGRAADQGIGVRLKQHITDRLNSRWDRFSWFGVLRVSSEGKLESSGDSYDLNGLIATMEALLIESVEPTQNRRRGDDFGAREFLQTDNPAIENKKTIAMLMQLIAKNKE